METNYFLLGPMHNLRILVICDSRGKDMLKTIKEFTLLNFVVRDLKGARLLEGVRRTKHDIIRLKPDYIILMNNVCNTIFLDKTGGVRRVGLRSLDPYVTAHAFRVEMRAVERRISDYCRDGAFQTRVIYAPVIGCHIQTFNGTLASADWRDAVIQHKMNLTVELLNIIIYRRNEFLGVFTPHTAGEVHHNDKFGKKKHRYERLGEDGLHFNEANRRYVALRLINCIVKNFLSHI